MRNIHLARAAQVRPFVIAAERAGAPVEKLVREAGMPMDVFAGDDCVLGELSAWRFIDRVAAYTRNSLFGFDVAQSTSYSSTTGPAGMPLAGGSELGGVLKQLIADAPSQSTASHYSLEPGEGGSWFRRHQPFKASMKSWQVEQYFLTFLIGIVRSFAGANWLPPVIYVSARRTPAPVPLEWQSIDFEWGHDATRMWIPDTVLTDSEIGDSARHAASSLTLFDLIETQVKLGRPGIEGAARELGVGASTIKRRLREAGTTYRREIENARAKLAMELLADPERKVSQVAQQLGYGFLPNFSRAFSRIAGESPTAFRKRVRSKVG